MKLWGGRFTEAEDQRTEEFNESLSFDKRMYRQDITGSIAHAEMLGRQGIISQEDSAAIIAGLKGILQAIEDGKLVIKNPLECSLCRACTDHLGEKGGITVTGDDQNFFFKFETDGSLTAQQALDKAVEILAEEANDFKAQLEQL